MTSISPSALRTSSCVRLSSADAACVIIASARTTAASAAIGMIRSPPCSTPGSLRGGRQWRCDPVGQRDVVAAQRHRHHGVIADQRRELDDAYRMPAREHAPVILLAHGLAAIELVGIVEHRESVSIKAARAAAGV